MKKILRGSLVSIVLLVGCAGETEEIPDGTEEAEEEATVQNPEVLAENLEVPWSIEKTEDTFYITERPGNIVKVKNGEREEQELEVEKQLSDASEAGLLGFVLAPDFTESNEAYAYYTYEEGSDQFNRIVRLQLEDNTWTEEELLLDEIPSGQTHHGGRLAIGPSESLYATTGDANQPDSAQETDSLAGKILKMNLDGSVPEDNPSSDSYVYSYGHRNAQGLTWSSDDSMYSSEHGATGNDEINRIEAGENYGWPVIEGEEEQEGMISPLITSGSDETWAPSGMDYYDNHLYVAGLLGSAIYEFDLETEEYEEVVSDFGRIRDVLIDEDDLYFISNNTDRSDEMDENDDKLYRIPLEEIGR